MSDDRIVELQRRIDADAPNPTPLRAVPMDDLPTAHLSPPRFVIEPLLPRDHVTLLAGHGDIGKTLLALTFAAHVTCGARFGDLACMTGRVLFVSLEDPGELIKLRLRRITEVYELDPVTVGAGVTVLDATDDDSALAFEIAEGGVRRIEFTAAFEQIAEAAAGHDLVVIDNASDAYDASEGERRMVRRFLRRLQRSIARKHSAAVLLLAHIDKAGARYGTAGETYSGSTAWHNTVRSRIALLEGDSGIELVHEKSNLAKRLETSIAFERSDHGVLVPGNREQKDSADKRAVFSAVRATLAAGNTIPAAINGPNTAAHVLARCPELPEDLADNSKRINAALKTLEREGAIRRETYRDGHRHEKVRYQCGSSTDA